MANKGVIQKSVTSDLSLSLPSSDHWSLSMQKGSKLKMMNALNTYLNIDNRLIIIVVKNTFDPRFTPSFLFLVRHDSMAHMTILYLVLLSCSLVIITVVATLTSCSKVFHDIMTLASTRMIDQHVAFQICLNHIFFKYWSHA